jgi:hypothetical protein
MELNREPVDQEDENEEVKGVERPPQKAGGHRMPLIGPPGGRRS